MICESTKKEVPLIEVFFCPVCQNHWARGDVDHKDCPMEGKHDQVECCHYKDLPLSDDDVTAVNNLTHKLSETGIAAPNRKGNHEDGDCTI